jgi:outer membrane protein
MNQRLLLPAAMLTVWLGGSAWAQTTNAVKIGMLNVFRVIAECAEGKQANEDFQRKFEAKKEELAKRQRELQDLQQQLQSQSKTLNDESRIVLSRSIDVKTTDLKRAQEDGDKAFTALRNQIFSRIGNRLAPIVQQYAKEYGYTFILDSSNQASQILYSDPAIEVTDDIVKRLDASQISTKTAAPVGVSPPGPSVKKTN